MSVKADFLSSGQNAIYSIALTVSCTGRYTPPADGYMLNEGIAFLLGGLALSLIALG